MLKKISAKFDKASEVYSEQTWLRALLNGVPYIGSSLDVVLASRGGIQKRRFLELIKDLEEEMSLIKEDTIDRAYLASEEFSDIALQVMEASIRTRDQDKIRLYARFLRGAILIHDRQQISLEDYLATLIELTPLELEVARAIYKQQYDSEPNPTESKVQWARRKGWNDLPNQVKGVPKEDLPFVLLRIQKSGLIQEGGGAIIGYEGGIYVITDSFRKLMRLIEGEVEKRETPA